MANKWIGLLLCAVFAACSLCVVAQESNSGKSKDSVRTFTGCLTKSGSGDEYVLTANDGSTWEAHANSSVDLASHVNQTVEAKGVVKNSTAHNLKEDSKDMAADSGMKKNNAEHGHLTITKLHTISDSCQR